MLYKDGVVRSIGEKKTSRALTLLECADELGRTRPEPAAACATRYARRADSPAESVPGIFQKSVFISSTGRTNSSAIFMG